MGEQRVIMFRAWDKKRKQMFNAHQIEDADPCLSQFFGQSCYEIMQFTGLKDKNGVEIYEGDILRAPNPIGKSFVLEIKWNEEWASFNVPCSSLDTEYREVIGNIYQDSHLLEAKP